MLLETMSSYEQKDWKKLPFENRVSAVTPGSKKLLEGVLIGNIFFINIAVLSL